MDAQQTYIAILRKKHGEKRKRDIWADSPWKEISELKNDDVGKVGEDTIQAWCDAAGISASINGMNTKELGGGNGDGIIKGHTVEIKTAQMGSTGDTFQHELGECPWNAEYMLFLDIAPHSMYITLFPNFTEEFYIQSGKDNTIKCDPVFPTKSICWRKLKGAFKLDTTKKINLTCPYTFEWTPDTDYKHFATFINDIIP